MLCASSFVIDAHGKQWPRHQVPTLEGTLYPGSGLHTKKSPSGQQQWV